MTDSFSTLVLDTIAKVREVMELDRWTLRPVTAPLEEARAACEALPEYRDAIIYVDPDKLKTGDDLDEMIVHELTHCHVGPLHDLAISLADALAESAPESHREALRKLLQDQVEKAAERVTTDVGFTYLRLLRRAGILAVPEGMQ